jgi:integrase/recombinase XerD
MPKRRDYFSEEELRRILSMQKQRNHKHRIWFRLLYSLGITIVEMVNLRVNDINFEDKKIKISGGKRHKERIISLPNALLADLKNEVHGKIGQGFLFEWRKGGVHPRTIQKALESSGSKLGLEANIVKFRKTLALHLLKCGWDEKGIAQMLGHSSPRATRKLLGNDRVFFETRRHPLDRLIKNNY